MWPASSSSTVTGRRGISRSRATIQAAADTIASTTSAPIGQTCAAALSGGIGSGSPCGQPPAFATIAKASPTKSQKPSRLR